MNHEVDNPICFPEKEIAFLCLLKKMVRLFKPAKPGENFCLISFCYRYRPLIENLILISDGRKNCEHIFVELECVLVSSYKFIDYSRISIDNTSPIIFFQL